MSIPLTPATISAALAKTGAAQRVELTDAVEPGLRLRSGGDGVQWSYLMRLGGGERLRVPLGPWPAVSVAAARAGAQALRSQVDNGRFDQDRNLTLAALLDRYASLELTQLRSGRSRKGSLQILIRSLSDRDVATLGRRDLAEALDEIATSAPVHANRMLAYAKAMFGWAVGRGYMETNPARSLGRLVREQSRERTPGLNELVRIWLAAEKLGYPFGHAVQLLICTAARRTEVASLRLTELRIGEGEPEPCWVLPASRTKNARSLRSPLSTLAQAVVAEAVRLRPKDSPFLFTTTGKTPISGWSRAKERLDTMTSAAEGTIEPWRLHDLRRSFATIACDVLHIDPAVTDRCLNHVGASTTSTVSRVYARGELFDQRKAALESWGELIAGAIERQRASALHTVAAN